MKFWILIINILTLLGLVACSASKEVIVDKTHLGMDQRGDGLPSPAPRSEAEGGLDAGGGGNGVNGKPLESYRVEITQLPAYQRLHEKILSKIVDRFPKLAADFLHITLERSWYFVPVPLRKLPAYKIGVSFKTDQFALQKLKEIWFDKLAFDKMSEDDQETLLLHELVMGVRLLEFTNLLDRCLTGISVLRLRQTQTHMDKYKEERRKCFAVNRNAAEVGDAIGLGKAIHLEDYDYDSIRELTSTLITKTDSFDPEEIEDWMAFRGLRVYPKSQ